MCAQSLRKDVSISRNNTGRNIRDRIRRILGIEEGDDFSAAAPNADACWRLKLLKMGFKIDTEESHNGSLENCKIIGLGDYDAIRQIWVNHLKALYNDAEAWETGEDYQ